MSRPYDLIVLGATGYTGKLVVEYLAKSSSTKAIRWAAAGRSKARVEAVLSAVGATSVPALVADTTDAASIEEIARQCTVIVTCAGPFDIHGPPVLAACLKHKTHYTDVTGEFTYVRRAIEEYHEEARRNGLFFVPTCGFDSVPSDIGNFLLNDVAASRGTTTISTRSYFTGSGGFSGGTAATICNIFKTIQRADLRPDSLNPRDGPKPAATPSKKDFWFDPLVGRWTAPFVMSGINERVVRRSDALFGRRGNYCEMFACTSLLTAVLTTVGFYLMTVALVIPFVRKLAQKYLLPAPGTGPDAKAMAKSFFTAQYRAQTADGGVIAASMKYGKSAYVFTAVSVVECALCILDLERLGAEKRAACGQPGGVLTPAAAFGKSLVERLSAAGVEIRQ